MTFSRFLTSVFVLTLPFTLQCGGKEDVSTTMLVNGEAAVTRNYKSSITRQISGYRSVTIEETMHDNFWRYVVRLNYEDQREISGVGQNGVGWNRVSRCGFECLNGRCLGCNSVERQSNGSWKWSPCEADADAVDRLTAQELAEDIAKLDEAFKHIYGLVARERNHIASQGIVIVE